MSRKRNETLESLTPLNAEEAEMVVEKIPETPPIIVKEITETANVIPKFSGTRFIGGKWYTLVKDTEMTVPVYVAGCLKAAGAVYL